MKKKKALELRKAIVIGSESLDDDTAYSAPDLFPAWKTDTAYAIGDRRRYGEILYKCLIAHTSQPDWTPDVAVSLWAKVLNPDDKIPEWEQPDSTNPYMKGDKVRYNGKIYESVVDNNIWSPDDYPAGWREVAGA